MIPAYYSAFDVSNTIYGLFLSILKDGSIGGLLLFLLILPLKSSFYFEVGLSYEAFAEAAGTLFNGAV